MNVLLDGYLLLNAIGEEWVSNVCLKRWKP